MIRFWTIIILSISLQLLYCEGQEWSYSGESGPNKWDTNYPECAQDRQSPIDIQRNLAELDEGLTAFDFYGYNNTKNLRNLTVWNDGYTITVRVHGHLEIEGGGLDGRYLLQHFHMHWGSQNNLGSEHIVDGQAYPLEIHLVHMAVRHENIYTALKDPVGLAVLGIFVKIGKPHPFFEKIISTLMRLDLGDWENVRPFPLTDILPQDTGSFYRYLGSLTTPPCSESVVWTVFHEPIEMSLDQVDMIRSLSNASNITDNFRPIQNLNGRRITVRKKAADIFGKHDNTEFRLGQSSDNTTEDDWGNSASTSGPGVIQTLIFALCLKVLEGLRRLYG